MRTDLDLICIRPTHNIREALKQMDASRCGIVLVVDADMRLVGTLTDGDMRRAVMANVDFGSSVADLLSKKSGPVHARPITARSGANPAEYLNVLKKHKISHLPLVDGSRRVVGLITMEDFIPRGPSPLQAVVMAGGAGQRLFPLTADVPKPMLPVGDRPLIEIIIQRLRDAGIRRVNIATHYKSEKFGRHFSDGKAMGLEISYVTEDRPLGTAGALGLLDPPKETTLVINGDILTSVDFRAMLAYHQEQESDLTVAIRQYSVQVPYGVVECEGSRIRRINEKPALDIFINAGIYLLEPSVYSYIPNGNRFDMTDLIQRLIDEDRTVVPFPVHEPWLDIGGPDEYQRAQELVRSGSAPS